MRDRRLERVEVFVERQQRVLAKATIVSSSSSLLNTVECTPWGRGVHRPYCSGLVICQRTSG